jgi:uncharacterized membrane protein (UPF0182 family)
MRRSLQVVFWLFVTFVVASRLVGWWVESWWFDEVGYRRVYLAILSTRLTLFACGAAGVAGFLWLHIRIAWNAENIRRNRQKADQQEADDEPVVLDEPPALLRDHDFQHPEFDRYRRWLIGFAIGTLSLLGGAAASLNWPLWLRLTHAADIGSRDPIFGRDLSFYLFQLPALQFFWLYVFVVGCLALVAVFIVYGHENEFEISGSSTALSPWALGHMALLGAGLLVWKAVGYQLVSYGLMASRRGWVFGIGYTDFYLRLPLLKFMMLVALLCAGLMWWWSRRGDVKRVSLTFCGYLGASALLLVIVPAVFQRLSVEPNDGREVRFTQWQIYATKAAYGLDLLDESQNWSPRQAQGSPHTLNGAALSKPGGKLLTEAAAGLPLWRRDSLLQVLNEMFAAAPGRFTSADLDRYQIGNEVRPVFVVARELSPVISMMAARPPGILRPSGDTIREDQIEESAQFSASWINRHFNQTHGYGLVICDANRTDASGRPLIYAAELGATTPGQNPVAQPQSELLAPLRVSRPQLFFGEYPSYQASVPQFVPPPVPVRSSTSSQVPADLNQAPALSPVSDAALPGGGVSGAGVPGGGMTNTNLSTTPVAVPFAEYVVVQTQQSAKTVASDNSSEYSDSHYAGRAGVPIGEKWRQWLLAWRFHDVRLAFSSSVGPQSRVLWHRRVLDRCRSIAPFLSYLDNDPHPVLTERGHIVWMLDVYTTSDNYPYSEPADQSTGWNYIRGTVKATVDAYDGTVQFYVADASDALVQCYARAFPELSNP